MLRGRLADVCRSLVCKSSQPLSHRVPAITTLPQQCDFRQIHSTSPRENISKKMLSKTRLFRLAKERAAVAEEEEVEEEEKEEEMEVEVESFLKGYTVGGITMPSLETFSATVDGVRYDQLPVAHIKATPNNTFVTLTDYTGEKIYAQSTCGREGFKNVKKSSTVASQATGMNTALKAMDLGVKNVRVLVRGLGPGRRSSIEGLKMAGLKIVSITDITVTPTMFPKPRKAKRL